MGRKARLKRERWAREMDTPEWRNAWAAKQKRRMGELMEFCECIDRDISLSIEQGRFPKPPEKEER